MSPPTPRSRAKTSDLSEFLRGTATSEPSTANGPGATTPSKKRRLAFLAKKKPPVPAIPPEPSFALSTAGVGPGSLPGFKSMEAPFSANLAKYVVPSPPMSMFPQHTPSPLISRSSNAASSHLAGLPPMVLSPMLFSPLMNPSPSCSSKRNAFYERVDYVIPPPEFQSHDPRASLEGRHGFDMHTRGWSGGPRPPLPPGWGPISARNASDNGRGAPTTKAPPASVSTPPMQRPLLSRIQIAARASHLAEAMSTSSTCSTGPSVELSTPSLSTEAESCTSHATSVSYAPSPTPSPTPRNRKKKHSITVMRELERALGTDVGLDSESDIGTDEDSEAWDHNVFSDAPSELSSANSRIAHGVRPPLQPKPRPSPLHLMGLDNQAAVPCSSASADHSRQALPTPPSSASTFGSAQHGHGEWPTSIVMSGVPGEGSPSAPPSKLPATLPPSIPLPPIPRRRPSSIVPVGTAPAAALPPRSRSNTTTSAPLQRDDGPRPPLPQRRDTVSREARSSEDTRSRTATVVPDVPTKAEASLREALQAERARCDRLVGRLAQLNAHHAEERAQLVRQVERLEREAKKHEREIKGLRWLVVNGTGAMKANVHSEPDTLKAAGSSITAPAPSTIRHTTSGLGLNLAASADVEDARAVLSASPSFSSLATSSSGSSLPSLPSLSSTNSAASALSSILESPPSCPSIEALSVPADPPRAGKDARHASWALARLSASADPFTVPPYTPSPPMEHAASIGRKWNAEGAPPYAALLARGNERVIVHERRATADMEFALERLDQKMEGVP